MCHNSFIHTYIYIHTYIHTNIHTSIHAYIHVYMHTYIHTYMHTYIHTYIRIHTYTHTYTHTHTHTHTHTRTRWFFELDGGLMLSTSVESEVCQATFVKARTSSCRTHRSSGSATSCPRTRRLCASARIPVYNLCPAPCSVDNFMEAPTPASALPPSRAAQRRTPSICHICRAARQY